jgi:polar amino acid transport system substrate-binding protein
MEEKSDDPSPPLAARTPKLLRLVALLSALIAASTIARADGLQRVRSTGRLVFGSDEEGGAPYLFLDRNPPHNRIGFEADLMDRLGRELGVSAFFKQALWENLLQVLGRGEIDVVANGYELTERRARDYLATRPYYVFQLQLMTLSGATVRSMADLGMPRPGGGRWKVGVLGGSAAETYLERLDRARVQVVRFDGATNAMMKVRSGQLDATLQDLPAAQHYIRQPEYSDLVLAGPPEGCGYYVMYLRKGDESLRDAIDDALGRLLRSKDWRAICEKYHIWNDAQAVLVDWSPARSEGVTSKRAWFEPGLLRDFLPALLLSALTTLGLSFGAMPIAIVLGLLIALGRLYGPRWLAWPLAAYVEVIRGTPLMLQLFVLFYVFPELGLRLSPWAAGITGLAINYSAYEAEIYRAGLQAIPRGQMEAALALGMSRGLALRRVIVPQAVRIVIPPVTSDFIALFKDTSVCSVLTLTELTKQYSILSNNTGGVIEFGIATAALYLAMSLPLSWFSRGMERRFDADGVKGGAHH